MAFCQKKTKTLWLWFAVDRERGAVIDFEAGCRGTQTLRPLWERVKGTLPLVVASDDWAPDPRVLPPDIHLQTKAETYTVEEVNARVRHYLARFRQKTILLFQIWTHGDRKPQGAFCLEALIWLAIPNITWHFMPVSVLPPAWQIPIALMWVDCVIR